MEQIIISYVCLGFLLKLFGSETFSCIVPPPKASLKETPPDISAPVEDERCEAGEQDEEPGNEAAERRQEAAQRAEEAAAGGEGRVHPDAPPLGDVQEETW